MCVRERVSLLQLKEDYQSEYVLDRFTFFYIRYR